MSTARPEVDPATLRRHALALLESLEDTAHSARIYRRRGLRVPAMPAGEELWAAALRWARADLESGYRVLGGRP